MTDNEIHMIYYGKDSIKAKETAVAIRADRKKAHVRHAEIFDGTAEPAAEVTILPCVSGHDAGRIRAAYGDKVVVAPSLPGSYATVKEADAYMAQAPVSLPPAPVPARNPNRR